MLIAKWQMQIAPRSDDNQHGMNARGMKLKETDYYFLYSSITLYKHFHHHHHP